jgi:hypothetical protein
MCVILVQFIEFTQAVARIARQGLDWWNAPGRRLCELLGCFLIFTETAMWLSRSLSGVKGISAYLMVDV